MYGKQTETAIAALSRLAEVYDSGKTKLSSVDIAADRGLQAPFVAKLLTVLSREGLVTGSPGPGGGYTLAVHPKQISLQQVYSIFEREDTSGNCPFGGGVCGAGEPCAIHDKLVSLQNSLRELLGNTNLEVFRKRFQDDGKRSVKSGEMPESRRSYRAPRARSRAT